jgi:hypothetical protein
MAFNSVLYFSKAAWVFCKALGIWDLKNWNWALCHRDFFFRGINRTGHETKIPHIDLHN